MSETLLSNADRRVPDCIRSFAELRRLSGRSVSDDGRYWRKAAVHTQTASRSAYQFGIRLGEGALRRSQWEAATSMLRWRVRTSGVRRSRFHPGRESRRSVGDQCDVFRTRRRLRCRMSRYISQIRWDVGRRGIRTHVPSHSKRCYAASWGIARSTNRKNRVLRVPDLNLPVCTETVSDNVW